MTGNGGRLKLEYFWADCPDGSHVAVNYTAGEGKISGSVRMWSRDAKVNRGRQFSVPLAELDRDAGGAPVLVLDGVCAEPLRVPIDPATVRQAQADRP
jgi:hypothetical protein